MKDTGYNSGFITYDDEATWLVTYADLMTLLLVFFVLLYSLAFFEKEKYKHTIESVKEAVDKSYKIQKIRALVSKPTSLNQKIRIEEITGMKSRDTALHKSISKFVRNSQQPEHLSLKSKNGKLTLTVSGEALFKSGSAQLNQAAVPGFNKLIDIFEQYPDYNINIKGHTDNIPIATQAFPSNWELSAIRATTVLKYLVSKGIKPLRLTATGYGEIIPLVPNTSDENRARNRRVEFVLEKKENY